MKKIRNNLQKFKNALDSESQEPSIDEQNDPTDESAEKSHVSDVD
jgi:hypothetical protein